MICIRRLHFTLPDSIPTPTSTLSVLSLAYHKLHFLWHFNILAVTNRRKHIPRRTLRPIVSLVSWNFHSFMYQYSIISWILHFNLQLYAILGLAWPSPGYTHLYPLLSISSTRNHKVKLLLFLIPTRCYGIVAYFILFYFIWFCNYY